MDEFAFVGKRSKKRLSIGDRGPIRAANIGPRRQIDKSLFASFSSADSTSQCIGA
jgi:hypothetical protein